MDTKLFSIILPTYNCENLIKDTLDSIIQQDGKLYECIVVDGISNDSTIDIIKKYASKYQNIRYITEKDNGVYDAMNKGIELSYGKYLYFIGAGDILYSDALKNVKNNIENEDLIMGVSYHCGKKFDFMPIKKKEDGIYLLFNHQAIFYKRKIFSIVGNYDSRYKIFADNVLNKKIIGNNSFKIKSINTRIAQYLGNGISENEFDKNIKNDFVKIILNSFGEEYIYNLYNEKINFSKVKYKRLIAWGTGGEYEKSCKIKEFNIDSFVESFPSKKDYKGKLVKSKEELLSENKEDIFIFVYSVVYYQEIRKWLEDNNFIEFEHFILMNEDILKLLTQINLI